MKNLLGLICLLRCGFVQFVLILLVIGFFLPQSCWEFWGQMMAFIIVFGVIGMFIGLFIGWTFFSQTRYLVIGDFYEKTF